MQRTQHDFGATSERTRACTKITILVEVSFLSIHDVPRKFGPSPCR